MRDPLPTVAVLGASGLIGQSVAETLLRDGFPVVAVARRLTPAQAVAFGRAAVVAPIADLQPEALASLLSDHRIDIVFNCVGVLQDSARGSTTNVHELFVARLIHAIAAQTRPVLLIHVSVPGDDTSDATAFSRTKRRGECLIASAALPSVILKPGFVIAPAAYGGSALIRALAALPFALPTREANAPFSATAVADIARTVASVARRWAAGEREWRASWELAGRQPSSVAAVIDQFRIRFGGPPATWRVPGWLLRAGALAGDGAARLGWSPPVRTTALQEMRRGVNCNPKPWIEATGIEPLSLAQAVGALPATVQERWFARLFLLKPVVIASLSLFWVTSGLIALTIAFRPASAILMAHGFGEPLADSVTLVTSLADIGVGVAIAVRRTCGAGLLAGVALSLVYMVSAALITPDMWVEPLGALVKTGPAIVLMLAALAMLEAR